MRTPPGGVTATTLAGFNGAGAPLGSATEELGEEAVARLVLVPLAALRGGDAAQYGWNSVY